MLQRFPRRAVHQREMLSSSAVLRYSLLFPAVGAGLCRGCLLRRTKQVRKRNERHLLHQWTALQQPKPERTNLLHYHHLYHFHVHYVVHNNDLRHNFYHDYLSSRHYRTYYCRAHNPSPLWGRTSLLPGSSLRKQQPMLLFRSGLWKYLLLPIADMCQRSMLLHFRSVWNRNERNLLLEWAVVQQPEPECTNLLHDNYFRSSDNCRILRIWISLPARQSVRWEQ